MKCINLFILLLVCSCVDPDSLDRLEDYAKTKLEHNINEFADAELKKWWDEYYKSQAMLILANGKAYETTVSTITRPKDIELKNNYSLLNELIKLYELNLSLKTLSLQTNEIEKNWDKVCANNEVAKQIGLKNSIMNNYINGLKFPTMAQTYMIGGGEGEEGFSKIFESISTNLGTLFNHDRVRRLKKQIKKVKSLFREKTPSEEYLTKRSIDVCYESSRIQRAYLESLKPLINKMTETNKNEWRYYHSQRAIIGNVLLKRNLSKNDKQLEEKLGHIAKNNLLTNLNTMRKHLLTLANKVDSQPTADNKEALQDFIQAFDSQLQLVKTLPYPGLEEVVATNLLFLNNFKGRSL